MYHFQKSNNYEKHRMGSVKGDERRKSKQMNL